MAFTPRRGSVAPCAVSSKASLVETGPIGCTNRRHGKRFGTSTTTVCGGPTNPEREVMTRRLRTRLREEYARHGVGSVRLRWLDDQLPADRLTIGFAASVRHLQASRDALH